MIQLVNTEQGVLVSVKAQPGAKRNAITGIHDGSLKVSVSQAPEKGKANAAIIEVLAAELKLKRNQIQLVMGQTSSIKKFLICGITASELDDRLKPLTNTAQ